MTPEISRCRCQKISLVFAWVLRCSTPTHGRTTPRPWRKERVPRARAPVKEDPRVDGVVGLSALRREECRRDKDLGRAGRGGAQRTRARDGRNDRNPHAAPRQRK